MSYALPGQARLQGCCFVLQSGFFLWGRSDCLIHFPEWEQGLAEYRSSHLSLWLQRREWRLSPLGNEGHSILIPRDMYRWSGIRNPFWHSWALHSCAALRRWCTNWRRRPWLEVDIDWCWCLQTGNTLIASLLHIRAHTDASQSRVHKLRALHDQCTFCNVLSPHWWARWLTFTGKHLWFRIDTFPLTFGDHLCHALSQPLLIISEKKLKGSLERLESFFYGLSHLISGLHWAWQQELRHGNWHSCSIITLSFPAGRMFDKRYWWGCGQVDCCGL